MGTPAEANTAEEATSPTPGRRTGDLSTIPGSYQFQAISHGHPVQRFWHKLKYEAALQALSPKSGDRILDAGCGSGILAARCAQIPGTEVIGLDSNDDALEFCRRKHRRRKNLRFFKGLVDEIGLPSESLSGITFLEVLEHITEEQGKKTLLEFHRLLTPGGRLVMTTPNYSSLWPLIEWGLDRFSRVPHLDQEQHVSRYNRKKVSQIAYSTGFEVCEIRTILFVAPWCALISESFARGVAGVEEKFRWLPGSLILATLRKQAS